MDTPNYQVRSWDELEGVETLETLKKYFKTRLRLNPHSRLSRIDIQDYEVRDKGTFDNALNDSVVYSRRKEERGDSVKNLFTLSPFPLSLGAYNFLDCIDRKGNRYVEFMEFLHPSHYKGDPIYRDEDKLVLEAILVKCTRHQLFSQHDSGVLEYDYPSEWGKEHAKRIFITGKPRISAPSVFTRDVNGLIRAASIFNKYAEKLQHQMWEVAYEAVKSFKGDSLKLK